MILRCGHETIGHLHGIHRAPAEQVCCEWEDHEAKGQHNTKDGHYTSDHILLLMKSKEKLIIDRAHYKVQLEDVDRGE